MNRGSRFSLQGLLLLALVPTLVLVTLAIAIIAYGEMRRSIIAGFDAKLTAVGTVTAAMIDPQGHRDLLAAIHAGQPGEALEQTEAFQQAVAPLRRIKQQLALTYLYTQAPMGGLDIVYVLDANTDENHSPPGTTDSLPEGDARNILSVLDTGQPYITDIQQWEQWGLIKTAFVPLPSQGRRADAMAGADVDISVINRKLRVALVSAGLIGAVSLLVALGVAVVAARRIAGPLAGMKLAGFRLAAGETSVSVPPRGARELADLAHAFNDMRETVRQEVARTEAADHRTEWERRTSGLLRLLNGRSGGGTPLITLSHPSLDGAVPLGKGGVIAWIATAEADPLRARIRALQVAHLASTSPPLPRLALQRLSPLLGHGLLALFALDGTSLTLRTGITLALPDGTPMPPGEHHLTLTQGQSLCLTGEGRGMVFRPEAGLPA